MTSSSSSLNTGVYSEKEEFQLFRFIMEVEFEELLIHIEGEVPLNKLKIDD